MKSKCTTVVQLARESGIEVDEALITLWDAGFDEITGPTDIVRRGDANRARRALGLATRRELSTPEHWQTTFRVSRLQLQDLLTELGVPQPYDGQSLRARAIHRLRAEQRRRNGGVRNVVVGEPTAFVAEVPPLTWEAVGHKRPMSFLSAEEVLAIHEELVADFASTPDPLNPPGVRSIQLLESAVHRPQTSLGDQAKYPTVEMAGAALLHALVHDHPFHNGNKRTALVALLVFLDENGVSLTCDEDALFKMVLQLAQHALTTGSRHELPDREVLLVARWIKQSSRLTEKGDRALPWRRLKQILASYGCTLEFAKVGNRINILRPAVTRTGFLGRPKNVVLKTQSHYGDDGREVDKTAINKLRRDLHLDDEHGIDSAAFYDNAVIAGSDFIVRYRKTLRRLARL